ncbi:hypothetical protein AKJ38_01230 [candidate division MSBL1 archaeon SCGC-AAA259I14]|uniref:Uncharacterized protein n=1 Tax=candidate division MSBL1 archaeon SCGC-AAA259I14 TaxID=1698268 RepID=A0A133UTG2_9EURY|nr:hypothetical protein AKJ38_01230 [candidate division MSBL1 archaeon SCGC-AAA259I14]
MKMVFDKLKSIFGGGGEEEEVEEGREREREKLSLEEVRKRIVDRKSHPLQEIEKDYQPILEKVSNIRGKIESLNKDLVGAEPGGEVHPNIYKSAKEGKRLLTDKADRAVEKMKAPQGPTWNSLLDLNESLKGAVNLSSLSMSSRSFLFVHVFQIFHFPFILSWENLLKTGVQADS